MFGTTSGCNSEKTLTIHFGNYPLTVGTPITDTWQSRRRRSHGVLDMLVDKFYYSLVGYIVADVAYSDGVFPDPQGTVFFLAVGLGGEVGNLVYAVTCRHVIEGVRGLSGTAIRINQKANAGLHHHPFVPADWRLSDLSDLAIMPIQLPPEADFWAYPIHDTMRGSWLTPGYDIFFIGLFAPLPGSNSVDALVRSGKVARVMSRTRLTVNESPKETIDADVLIVESRSWGGESGSPVFAYEESYRLEGYLSDAAYPNSMVSPGGRIIPNTHPSLIGVMHGHWPIKTDVKDHDLNSIGGVEVNSGVAAVLPLEHLHELLMRDDLVKERERIAAERQERYMNRSMPKPDRVASTDLEFTREDFENALKKVSKRIQPLQSGEEK